MNYHYARALVLLMLGSLAVYNLVRGLAQIRSRTDSTWVGWLRIAFGVVIAVAFLGAYRTDLLQKLIGF